MTKSIEGVFTCKVKHNTIMVSVLYGYSNGYLSFKNMPTFLLVDLCQQSNSPCLMWIGGTRSTGSKFIWSKSGKEIISTQWSPREPNNSNDNEDCIEMKAATGKWNDKSCDNDAFFMCEMNLN